MVPKYTGKEWRRAIRRAEHAYRRARRAARIGLVHEPYLHARYWAEYSPNGRYLAVRSTGVRQCIPPKKTRGRVTQFSKRSRSRMLQLTAQVNSSALERSVFVTLTYPSSLPMARSTYKRHFQSFLMRCRRRWPSFSAIWKLEFQKRGAVHWHLVILSTPFVSKEWLSRTWYEIVGSNDERHLRAGTNVQRCQSTRQALSYVAKYIAKLPEGETPAWEGRFWGFVGRQHGHVHTVRRTIDARGHARLARAIRNVVRSRSRAPFRSWRRRHGWCFFNGARASVLVEWADRLK